MFKWFANILFPRNKILGYVDESVERNTIKHKPIIQRESPDELKHITNNLSPGELSANVNWISIEQLGEYLSPIGNDNLHEIIIYEKARRSGLVKVATIECTNSIYSEWVKCLCESMWHLKHKVLYDIHGNAYPMGQMLEMTCSIKYK